MGHSLGGLEVILLQDLLVSQGTNLRQEYQIKNAILLAPAIPAPLPWSFLGTGAAQLIPMAGLPMSNLLGGQPTYHPDRPRVSANANSFAPCNGVQLTLIADEFDRMMNPEEELPLYVYLTGTTKPGDSMLSWGRK